MRYIEKRATPKSLEELRNTPDSTYEATEGLREALAEEQGYICAFCMRHLNINGKKINNRPPTKIAHLLSRNPKNIDDPKEKERCRILGMTYQNMVLACDGYSGDVTHCDVQQDNDNITIPLFNKGAMGQIHFSSSGAVLHPNSDYQDQIGYEDGRVGFLNLNAEVLRKRRQARWLGAIRVMPKAGTWKKSDLENSIHAWSSRDSNNQFKEDCQYVVYQLTKKLNSSFNNPAVKKK